MRRFFVAIATVLLLAYATNASDVRSYKILVKYHLLDPDGSLEQPGNYEHRTTLTMKTPWFPCDGCQYVLEFNTIKNWYEDLPITIDANGNWTTDWSHDNYEVVGKGTLSDRSILGKWKQFKILNNGTQKLIDEGSFAMAPKLNVE